MKILYRLTQLANKLDKKGLYSEAAALDDIIKIVAQSPIQQLQGLSRSMTNNFIDTIVSNIGTGAKAGGQKSIIEKYRNKLYPEAYREITEFVKTQPELRGALNAGLKSISPMVGQYAQLRHEIKQEQKPDVGIAGSGKQKEQEKQRLHRSNRILASQKAYNNVYDQLSKLGLNMEAFPNKLKEDAVLGRNTRNAMKFLSQMKKILANELKKQQQSSTQKVTNPQQKGNEQQPRQNTDTLNNAVLQLSNALTQKQGKPVSPAQKNWIENTLKQLVQSTGRPPGDVMGDVAQKLKL